ncbi:MAG: TraR/DksA family transcriptional regulator [Solirubrobacteraceae bacterium]
MDTDHARELLTAARLRIEQALAGSAPDPGDPDVGTSADNASELTGAGVDDAVAEGLRDELAAIERAEQRVSEGTYGLSVESGDPIPEARLEAFPWAERTVEEQARYEQGA